MLNFVIKWLTTLFTENLNNMKIVNNKGDIKNVCTCQASRFLEEGWVAYDPATYDDSNERPSTYEPRTNYKVVYVDSKVLENELNLN